MSYWDTSALSKLYFPEPDSLEFVRKAAAEAVIITARLGIYEMLRVSFRKESEGFIPTGAANSAFAQVEQDIAAGEIRVVEIDPQVESEFKAVVASCYRHLPPLPIRTFDALHLATARVAGETELVATDKRMRNAGKILGFSLFPV